MPELSRPELKRAIPLVSGEMWSTNFSLSSFRFRHISNRFWHYSFQKLTEAVWLFWFSPCVLPWMVCNSYLRASSLVMASIFTLVSWAALLLTACISISLILLIAASNSFMLSSFEDIDSIFFSFDSSKLRILLKFTLDNTSNSRALVSSSSNRFDLVFLYWSSFYFSLPSFLISSLNLSIIFSWVAISCWALSISYLRIFSRFSPSASCSHRVVLEVSCCLRLSILYSFL